MSVNYLDVLSDLNTIPNALTDAQLRASPVPVIGAVSTGGLTDSQLRATPVPVSGTVATSNGLTDAQLRATPVPVTSTAAAEPQTFSASLTFLPGALPTDVFTVTGSATRTVKVRKFVISGTSTAIGKVPIDLVKRSTANTLGTSSAVTRVPHDSNNAAATATVLAYTSPPVTGTLVGSLSSVKLSEPAAGDANLSFPITISHMSGDQPYTLRGVSQVLAINRGGVTNVGESLTIAVEWTEEAP